jgi:hypothetical protein
MALRHGPVTLEDVDGRRLQAAESLVASGTVRAGVYAALPGRTP